MRFVITGNNGTVITGNNEVVITGNNNVIICKNVSFHPYVSARKSLIEWQNVIHAYSYT